MSHTANAPTMSMSATPVGSTSAYKGLSASYTPRTVAPTMMMGGSAVGAKASYTGAAGFTPRNLELSSQVAMRTGARSNV